MKSFASLSEREQACVLEITNRWQSAAGLRYGSSRASIAAALEHLRACCTDQRHPVVRLLVRGYLLELSAGLHAASGCLPTRLRRQVNDLSDRLAERPVIDAALSTQIERVLVGIGRLSAFEDPELAHRLRREVDSSHRRLRTADLAHIVGTNARYVRQAFKRAFDVTISKYERQQMVEMILFKLDEGISVKEVAELLDCSERTVRRLVRAKTGRCVRELRGRPDRLRELG